MEIRNLEQKLSDAGITLTGKYDVLTQLARLRQLSGDIAGAAANWLDAAVVLPNEKGDTALVSGAYCLAAIGEWENAVLTLRSLVASNKQGPLMLQARYLDASLKTWISATGGGTGGDASTLAALADNPEFAGMKPTIYYTLWRTLAGNPRITGAGNAESWKARLLAEFPKSPEARLANPNTDGRATAEGPSLPINTVQRPLWLLAPENIPSLPEPIIKPQPTPAPRLAPVQQSTPVQYPSPTQQTKPVPQPSPVIQTRPPEPKLPPPPVQGNTTSTTILQTGLFGREANARSQAELLRKAGFTPAISRKTVNGTEHWAVTVPAGQDLNKTALDLKKAGFDSFPVRNN